MLEELLTNVISYGVQAPGKCQTYAVLEAVGDHIILKLRDNGQPFNPTALPDPDLKVSFEDRTVGGLGILLVRHLTDHMHYERRGDENHLTLRKSRMRPN